MANPTVGYAAVQIIPSAKGFKAALDAEISPHLRSVGERSGKELGEGLKSAGRKAGKDAGESTAKGFREKFRDDVKGFFNADDLRKEFSSAKTLGVAAIGAGIGAGLAAAVGEASNLAESVNAVNVTFGDSAKAVLAVGENSATSFGLAKSEFNQLAVQFSAFAKNIASGSGESVDKVLGDLTTRAADFASVMNLDLAEATQVFMSSLAGETEPIRRFGKDISAAAVEQFALSEGLADSKDELTESIKVQARYGLLMQQTADTTGDFKNTSDEMANSQRIARAQIKDAAASLGEDLLPVVAELTTLAIRLIETGKTLRLDKIFAIPNSLISGAEKFGRELRIALDFNEDFKNNWEIIERFEGSAQAAADFDRELLKNARTFAEVRAIVIEYTGDQEAANQVALEWRDSLGLLNGQTLDQKEAIDELAESTNILRGQSDNYVSFLEQRAISAQREQFEAVERSRKEHQLLADAVKRVRDEIFASLDSMFDYEESTAATFFAARDFRETLEETPDDLWAVREAEIAAAEAALKQAEDFAAAAGATEESTVKAQLMKLELENLQAKFPELHGVIQGYIDQLNRIPAVKETQLLITAEGRGFTAQLTNPFGRIIDAGGFDSGGVVDGPLGAPRLALVHAGETILATHKDGGGGFGGAGIIVNIEGPVYGHMLPEMIIDGVTQAARENGSQWLRDLVDA